MHVLKKVGSFLRACENTVADPSRWGASDAAIAVSCLVACVSNATPTPSREPASEDRAHQPAGAPLDSPLAATGTSAAARPSPQPTTVDLKRELGHLPQDVLAGTDIVPLGEYLDLAAAIPTSGTFRSEQGGATLEVRLAPEPQGINLTRAFEEPGTPAQTKRYEGLELRANGVRLSGTTLEVLGIGSGVLVLEEDSGVDGIPTTLWIEYGGAFSCLEAGGLMHVARSAHAETDPRTFDFGARNSDVSRCGEASTCTIRRRDILMGASK